MKTKAGYHFVKQTTLKNSKRQQYGDMWRFIERFNEKDMAKVDDKIIEIFSIFPY